MTERISRSTSNLVNRIRSITAKQWYSATEQTSLFATLGAFMYWFWPTAQSLAGRLPAWLLIDPLWFTGLLIDLTLGFLIWELMFLILATLLRFLVHAYKHFRG